MNAIPIELKQANEFVERLHRHHKPVHRDKLRIGCEVDSKLCALNWDKGKGVQFNTLDKLCQYFNCNISDLLVYEEEKMYAWRYD